MKQINTKGLFKAVGDILMADATIVAGIGTNLFLEATSISSRTKIFGTMGLNMGGTWDNLPTKEGTLSVAYWSQVSAANSDTVIRDLGDRTEFLLDSDAGRDRINEQGVTGITVRHIQAMTSLMYDPDSRDWKKYGISFRIILSKSYK